MGQQKLESEILARDLKQKKILNTKSSSFFAQSVSFIVKVRLRKKRV